MSRKRKVLQGSASNLIRVLLSMLVSLVLPPFLVRHMAAAEYSAWVLILQLSAYVGLLDFGLQVAIGKFVAEYDASGDRESSHSLVSTSFTLLAAAAAVACGAIAVIALSVPRLFHQMPAELVPEVRIAILAVGLSTAIALPFSTFASTFTGLQQYIFPTVVATVTRVGSAASLIILLLLHASLVQMALVLAAFNVASAAAQFVGWQKFIKQRVAFSFLVFHRRSAVKLAKYGSVLSVWTLSMLLISGLDVVIVGHYHYRDTGFYSVANGAATFMLALISSAFGPLVPAVSSLQSTSTPERLGELCIRTTRYCTLLLLLLGLPLFFGAYPLLGLWVGKRFADQSATYLEVLVAANVVRQLAFAYILIVVATGRQHLATLSQVVEAGVNIVLSLWLVQRIGTVGVALGTFAGAFVGLGMHLLVSMPRTQPTIRLEYSRFLLEGLLRPLLMLLPALCFYPFWRRLNMLPAQPWILALWAIITAAIAWWMVLTAQDRQEVKITLNRLSDRRVRKNA
jgi:O-antigen/teichoic acid export membrane protein